MGGTSRLTLLIAGCLFLGACDGGFDFDLRDMGNGFDTTNAARAGIADRPAADTRGVISYPNYQIVVARRGDTVADVAGRIGLGADELARHNGLTASVALRDGEVLALPRRVAEPSAATGAITSGPLQPGEVDIATLAGDAINRAGASQPGHAASAASATGVEPIRHRVQAGETAYTIARLYDVSVRALADWNGLPADFEVREGQYLLIPVVIDQPAGQALVAAPGAGSIAPEPPSAAEPLPVTTETASAPAPAPAADSGGTLAMPVRGTIIREYKKGTNDGIDISAPAGSTVVAAEAGEVAAVTRDTDQVPILVIRHADNLLTVYAGVENLTVKKGDRVSRGQKIAVIRDTNPSFLHFEVRRGLDSADPMDFLN